MKITDTTSQHRFRTTNADIPRAVAVAAVLLSLAAVGALVVIEAFARLQVALGYGDDIVVTYLVGGTFGTLFLGAIAVGYLRIRPVTIPARRPTVREVGWAVLGVVVALVGAVVISVVGTALGVTPSTNFIDAAAAENPLLVYGAALVGVVVLIAPLEELLYRGVVQGRLRESLGPAGAIGITSVLFALSHLASYWYGGSDLLSLGVAVSIVSIAFTSSVLGVLYERTANLTVPIVSHALFNVVLIALSLATAL